VLVAKYCARVANYCFFLLQKCYMTFLLCWEQEHWNIYLVMLLTVAFQQLEEEEARRSTVPLQRPCSCCIKWELSWAFLGEWRTVHLASKFTRFDTSQLLYVRILWRVSCINVLNSVGHCRTSHRLRKCRVMLGSSILSEGRLLWLRMSA
jgi:hypothetical protein